MNKIIILLLVVVFYTGGHTADAQTTDKAYLLSAGSLHSDRAAVRATRDLWNRVGDRKEEAWYKLPNGYLAFYKEGAVESRHVYNQKGSWLYSLMTYPEMNMPAEIRKEVRSNYYDYSIVWVKEVREDDELVYVVHIENGTEWKDLSVRDGQIQVLKTVGKR